MAQSCHIQSYNHSGLDSVPLVIAMVGKYDGGGGVCETNVSSLSIIGLTQTHVGLGEVREGNET
jgi:hypothetical protein